MSRTAPRRLGTPIAVRVQANAIGYPQRIEGARVEAVRESWLIEDRWWAPQPIRRRYCGGRDRLRAEPRDLRDLRTGTWYRQAALG